MRVKDDTALSIPSGLDICFELLSLPQMLELRSYGNMAKVPALIT